MAGRKRFSIPAFQQRQGMDVAAAEGTWSALSLALDEIHMQNASTLSFEELYRNAYNLVLHKHGELLYNGVRNKIREQLTQTVQMHVSERPDEQLLQAVAAAWTQHRTTMTMVKDILMYMDRTFVTQHKKTPVYALGLQLFREVVAFDPAIRPRLQAILLQNIDSERADQLIDRELMKSILSMLVDLGVDGVNVYEEEFETPFLDATRLFYRQESQTYLAQNTCPDYLRKAEARLTEESMRVQHYLAPQTELRLKGIVEGELIATHANTLVEMENSGCACMMRDDKIDDLANLYRILCRVPSTLPILRTAMSGFVKHRGREILAEQESTHDPLVFVQNLLGLKNKFDRIVDHAFLSEQGSRKKLKEAFEEFINADVRSASYLAAYVDTLLRSALKGFAEAEAEAKLDEVIIVFRYLQDKDIFENAYKQHLAKRLLSGRSVSDDAEKTMIAKLKTECGYQFTSKMEGMFTDMRISQDTMNEFRHSGQHRDVSRDLEVEVNVLTGGFWPVLPVPACILPAALLERCRAFEQFYLSKHTGRKVSWYTSMGSADLRCTFRAGRRELNVTTYQMCILLLFNEQDDISRDEIQQRTNIPDGELRRHILSLCTPKFRILRKSSRGKGVADDDIFSFNPDFTSKLRRIKIPLVSAKETVTNSGGAGGGGASANGRGMGQSAGEGTRGNVPAAVEEDRRHMVEAVIVRTMKTRRQLHHNELVAEVTRQLSHRFVPTVAFIKKRIESLIEREYLQRNANDRRLYTYIA